MTCTITLSANAARASMSALSPVSIVPPGSARATTSASTAEPARALRRSSAARRATSTLTIVSITQVLRKRFVFASRLEFPCNDSARTTLGTIGGQRPWLDSAWISDSATFVRLVKRETPPLSRTSTISLFDPLYA